LTLDNGAGGGWCWIGRNYPYERIFFHYCISIQFDSDIVFVFVDMLALTFLYCLVFFYIRNQLRKFNRETSSTEHQSSGNDQELERWQADLEAMTPQSEHPNQILTTQSVSVISEDRRPSGQTYDTSGTPLSLANTSSAHSQVLARKRMLQVARSLLWYPLIYLCVTAPLTIGRLATFAGDSWSQTCIFVGATFFACGGLFNVLLYTSTRKGIISWTWWRKKDNVSEPPTTPHIESPRRERISTFPGAEKLGSKSSASTESNQSRHGRADNLGIRLDQGNDGMVDESVGHHPDCIHSDDDGGITLCTCKGPTEA
jgi:hypothetical protein